jgi:hypothetical protein
MLPISSCRLIGYHFRIRQHAADLFLPRNQTLQFFDDGLFH